jgi:hypothetical protein
LLLAEGVTFCRFADDYHLFANDYETAFKRLLYLSQKLFNTQGLQLQKAKTRIASGQEFLSTSPIREDTEEAPADRGASTLKEQSQNLMRLSIKFDPYSPTAEQDYEALKKELEKVDIVGLLKAELTKSRVHISLEKNLLPRYVTLRNPNEVRPSYRFSEIRTCCIRFTPTSW